MTNGDSCSKPSLVKVDFGDVVGVYSVNFSPKQQYFVAGCGNGAIQVNKLKITLPSALSERLIFFFLDDKHLYPQSSV